MGQDFHVCQTKPGGVKQAGGFIISGVQRAMNAMEHCITKRPALQLLLGIQHQHTDILRAADEIGRARAAQLVPGAEAPQNAPAPPPRRRPTLTKPEAHRRRAIGRSRGRGDVANRQGQ